MTDNAIIVRNIYWMLAYAFRALQKQEYQKIAAESFENVQDLLAAIMEIGVSNQLKHGLYREYIEKHEELKVLQGKLNLSSTLRRRIRNNKQVLVCEHDDFSVNNVFNRIIRTTLEDLMHDKRVKRETRVKLRNILRFFSEIEPIALSQVHWNRLQYHRNNNNYELLLNICYFVYTEKILSNQPGTYKVAGFSEKNMPKLYEKFILEYYKKHYPKISVSAAEIAWNLDDDFVDAVTEFLPKMQSDITLRYNGRTLIIDAKYYSHMMQQQYDKYTLHSGNLYQIFTYVKNEDTDNSGKVAGLVLYAKANNEEIPRADFSVGGNRISARVLDLNVEFEEIERQLRGIVEEYLGE